MLGPFGTELHPNPQERPGVMRPFLEEVLVNERPKIHKIAECHQYPYLWLPQATTDAQKITAELYLSF